jgi:trimeric autotransporter adhesin
MLEQRRAASAVDRLRAQLSERTVVMPHDVRLKRQRSEQRTRPHSAPAARTSAAAAAVVPHDVSVAQASAAITTASETVLTQQLPVNVMVNGPAALLRELKVDSISRAEFFNIFYSCTDNRLTLADLVCTWRIHSIHADGAAERSMGPDGFAFACTAAAKAKHAHGAYRSATPAALTRLLLREAYTFYSPSAAAAAAAGRGRKGRGSHELLWGGSKALFGPQRYVLRLDIADFLTEQHAFASALFASGLADSDGEGPMSWAKVAATNARLPYTGFVALLAELLQAPEASLLQAPLASPQALAAAFSAARTAPHRARQAAAMQAAAATSGRAAAAAAAAVVLRDANMTGSSAKYSSVSDEHFDREPGLLYPQFVEALLLLADAAAAGLRHAYPDITGASSAGRTAAASASQTGLRGGLKLAASRRRRSQLQQQLQAAALMSAPTAAVAAVVSAATASAEAAHELCTLQALFHHLRCAVAAKAAAAAAAAPAALVCAVPETDSDCDETDGLLGLAWARSPSPHRHRGSPSPTRTAVKHSSTSSSAARPQSAPDRSRARLTVQQQQPQQPLTIEESAARAAAVESQLLAALDRVEALATAAAPQRVGPLSLLQPAANTAAPAAVHSAQRRHTTGSVQPAIALVMLDVPVVPPHAPEPVQRLLETALTHQAAGHCSAAAAAVAAAAALWRGLVTRLTTAERVALLLAEASVAQAAASGCTAALRAAAEAVCECLSAAEAAQRSALPRTGSGSTVSNGTTAAASASTGTAETAPVPQSMAQALGLSEELLSALAAALSVAGAAWYYSERTALALRAYALAAHLLLPLLPPPHPPAAPPVGRGKAAVAAAAAAAAAVAAAAAAAPTVPLEEPRYVCA